MALVLSPTSSAFAFSAAAAAVAEFIGEVTELNVAVLVVVGTMGVSLATGAALEPCASGTGDDTPSEADTVACMLDDGKGVPTGGSGTADGVVGAAVSTTELAGISLAIEVGLPPGVVAVAP